MKKSLFAVVLSVAVIASVAFFPTTARTADLVRSVSVKGEGEIKSAPDRADVNLRVRTKAKDAKSAQAKNAKEMARVQKVLRDEFKVDAKDIQTTGFIVQPEYQYGQNGKQTFLGFLVDHGLTVKTKKLDQLGPLLDSLTGRGTDDVSVALGGVSFGSDKRQELEIQAMELAMKNAEARAAALAKFGKRSLKGVLRISDSSVGFAPPPFVAGARMAKMEMMASDASGGTSVAPGEITITSEVSVEYQLD